MEQTFILIKPDGVHLGLAGKIMSKLEKKGFTLKDVKMITMDRAFAEKHHQDMSAKSVFSRLVDYIISGPVVAMIWEGTNVVSTAREIIRKMIPTASDLDRKIGSNLIHGSDSVESAYKEISLWFPDGLVKLPSDEAIPNASDIGRISAMGHGTTEQTLILIMPYGVKNGLVGHVIRCFDKKGFTLKGLKMVIVDRLFAEKHYQHFSTKPFFSDRVNYISSGPLVAMIWEGDNVVSTGSEIIRNTVLFNDMDTDIGSNLIHWSDSLESAIMETAMWFPDGPVKVHSDAAKPKARDIGRIAVTGFDSGVPREDVESALREHVSSCGKITDLYFLKKSCAAYIYLVGEGAVDKAMKLSGSDVGGWKVCVTAYPFYDNNGVKVTVRGYSTLLTHSTIKTALEKLFSSCGKVTEICTLQGFTTVVIEGYDAAEKAVRLSGSNIGRHKVLVKILTKPPRHTIHNRRRTWLRVHEQSDQL